MTKTLIRFAPLGCLALLTACNTSPAGENLIDDTPGTVVEDGKADDYFGSLSAEYDLQTAVQITLENDDVALEGEERLARARELAVEEMERITSAVDDKIYAVPGVELAIQDPGGPSAAVDTIANEDTAPSTPTFSRPVITADVLSIGDLDQFEWYGVWMHRVTPAGAFSQVDAEQAIIVKADAA